MKLKKIITVFLSVLLILSSLSFLGGCAGGDEILLRVYSWEEYIDEGGEDSYAASEENPDPPAMIDEFEIWYEETYGKKVRVEYSTFGTNEDMYNQLKLGNTYDLVCPSEYMIMKLAAEGMIEPFSEAFFDESNELNYYVNNVSPFIANVFKIGKVTVDGVEHSWNEYAAGYMWGTTGLVYNPARVSESDLQEKGWSIMLDPAYKKKVTTKDNVRDSYFVGLAICYERELLALKAQMEAGELSRAEYTAQVTEIMNRTDEDSVRKVQDVLFQMRDNIFGFETDTGKADMVKGTIWMNFAWSGDAVYAMDEAEGKYEDDTDGETLKLNFYIPQESANLFFDGWTIPKDSKRTPAVKQAAEAFVNFMAIPENAVRNMDYIGYTSVIAGDDVLDYIKEKFEADENDETATPYDVSYFFGEENGTVVFNAPAEQLKRQLYAQYPPEAETFRCAVMDYYGERDARINELWTQVKGATLDAWAITVLVVAAVAIIVMILLKLFGHKIELPRKVKKGYTLVKQEKA